MKYSDTLKDLFATHPKVDKFYFTSDGQAFIEKHHADAHAPTLEEKTVTPASRAVFEQVEAMREKLATNAGTGENQTTVTPPAPKAAVKKEKVKKAKAAPAPAPAPKPVAPVVPAAEAPALTQEPENNPETQQ